MLSEVLLRKPRRYKSTIYAIYYHVLTKNHLYQKTKQNPQKLNGMMKMFMV